LEDTAAAHGHMLEAARAGDAEAYREAVREHYRPLEKILDAQGR
ncbi:MAG: GntR family transcriptional regulator, partial [bacterium]|nr:GntR family transcriptional regulator [bacterium]